MIDNKLIKGLACFVMALIVWAGCAGLYLLHPSESTGSTCGLVAFFIGGGLAWAGLKLFGVTE